MRRARPLLVRLALAGLFIALVACSYGMVEAAQDPVVKRQTVAIAGLERPIRIALVSDTHVSWPDMPPARLARIVNQVNGQKPDLIVLAGDFIGNGKLFVRQYAAAPSVAPLAGLRAPLGVVAVLGNHDYRHRDNKTLRRSFAAMGVTLLENSAVRRGPVAIGGLSDVYNGHPNLPRTMDAMYRLGGVPVLLSHSPDIFPRRRNRPLPLTLVGHTHCGQVRLPFIGALWVPSRYYLRYSCGTYRQGNEQMIVGGGVGTSGLPIRILTPPEFRIITLVPQR